ncbi:MAG: hypothetical protein WDM85_05225 [Caulobacteraceae bacterium]
MGGWKLGEVALFYGLVSVIFAFADAIARGFDVFGSTFVKTGAFDRLFAAAAQPGAATARLRTAHDPDRPADPGYPRVWLGLTMTHLSWSPYAAPILAFAVLGGVRPVQRPVR